MEKMDRITFEAINRIYIPQRETKYSAGYDLKSTKAIQIRPGEAKQIPTGVSVDMPNNFFGLVSIRSSMSFKHGLSLLNSPGIIDADYKDEIFLLIYNHSDMIYKIKKGERVAQIIFLEYQTASDYEFVSKVRDGGIGSTG